MTYYNLEKSLADLKIVSEARALREENDKLIQTLNQKRSAADAEISQLKAQLHSLEKKIQDLSSSRINFSKKEYSRKEFKALVKQHVDDTVKKRISKGVERKFQEELPSLISSEIQKFPENCSPETYLLIEAQAKKHRDELLKSSTWPPWFNEWVNQKILSDVNSQLDKEFYRSVDASAYQQLESLRMDAWPQYLNDVVTPYLQNSITSQLLTLNTTIQIECYSCGGLMDVTITPDEIALLLRTGKIKTACIYCEGIFRPKIRTTLGDLIWTILTGDNSEPREQIVGKYKVIGFEKPTDNT